LKHVAVAGWKWTCRCHSELAAYHFNDRWAFSIGIENPNQFIGDYVAMPGKFTSVGSQFDNGNQIAAPNAFPDILSKLAYDRSLVEGDISTQRLWACSPGCI
jgi:hypothetical protein